jgi:hypothetical protein
MTLNLPLPLAEINRRSPRASATLACHAHDRRNAHASAGHNRRGSSSRQACRSDCTDAEGGSGMV